MELNWSQPDYTPIWQDRVAKLKAIRANPEKLPGLKAYYAENPADWISDFGVTFDPRAAERGLRTTMPFLLFQKQREFIDWLHARWKGREDGLVEKSRDMGVSWLSCAFAAWMWTFHPGTVIGFGSRKEDMVDRIGDPSSLFWKIRTFIDMLPAEFKPAGYDPQKHAPFMRVLNPANGSSIIGEAGTNIGRGARTSIYLKDEAAFFEQPEQIDAALSQTSNCKIDISTPNGEGNPFWRKRFGGRIPVFVFDWRAQPLDAKLMTPTGWRQMGDIAAGDYVIGRGGKSVKVLGVVPHGVKPVYRVTFSDGAATECCEDHLWSVISSGDQRVERRHILKTMPLREIKDRYVQVDGRGYRRHLYQIPLTEPVEFAPAGVLPLDPYVLGCLLGDGSLSSNPTGPHLLTVGDAEIAAHCASRLPAGCVLQHDRGIQYRFAVQRGNQSPGQGRGRHSPVAAAIRDLGLVGAVSHTKFIPQAYMLSGQAERLELLRGLLDTDGHVPASHAGAARLSTTSRRLADDVAFVARSLGGVASVAAFKPAERATFSDGRVCPRRNEAYTVLIKLPDGVVPFKLARKVAAFKPATRRPPRRSIVSIELVGDKPVQCISVSAGDGLYLTDDFVVTHNCDPRKGEEWYARQQATLDPVVLAQEVDRNYSASIGNSFIDGSIVTTAMQRGPVEVAPMGPLRVGVDVARFGDDKSVLTFRRGRVVIRQIAWGKTDLASTAGRVKQEVQTYLRSKTGIHLEQIAVDTTGMGAGVADMLRGWFTTDGLVVDVDAGNRLDDGQNYNLRAFMWSEMRDWIGAGASLPNDQELRADLTGLRYGFRQGLLLLESKDDAKKRGVKSPDRADSLALTFAKPGGPKPKHTIPSSRVISYGVDNEIGM